MNKGIPSLNLGKVRGGDSLDATLTPQEVDNRASNTPTEGDGVDSELDGAEDSYRDMYSYRDYSAAPTPHTSRGVDASELLGCNVYEIHDVAVLQCKLIEAQKLFRQLDDWYGKELERKEQQLNNIIRSVQGGVPPPASAGANSARGTRSSRSTVNQTATPRSGYALASPHTATGSSSLPGTGRGGAGNRTPAGHFRSLPAYHETTGSRLRQAFSPAYGGANGGEIGSARGGSSARSQPGFSGSTPTPRGGGQLSSRGKPTATSTSAGAAGGPTSARGGVTPRSSRVETSTPFSSRSYGGSVGNSYGGGGGSTSARGTSSARGQQQQAQPPPVSQQQQKRGWDRTVSTNSNLSSGYGSSTYGHSGSAGGGHGSGFSHHGVSGSSPRNAHTHHGHQNGGGKNTANGMSPRRTAGIGGGGHGSSAAAQRRAVTPRY